MKANIMNLQRFAGENNYMGIKTYSPQFIGLLQAVFESRAYFSDFFVGNTVEALDGIGNKKAFSLKVCDIPVAVGSTYDTGAAKAFGAGTENTTRWGNRTEIKYTDEDVDYTWEWTMHEGIDRATVNYDFNEAIADRMELQARAKVNKFNQQHGKFISASAGTTVTTSAAALTADDVAKVFNEINKAFTDAEVVGTKVAKVSPDFYNLIVDSALAVTSKGSSVNIDENGIVKFKGFQIQEVPSSLFQTGEVCYAYVTEVAKAFTGIDTVRTFEAEGFNGVALQGAGKAGEYIPAANKKAVAKVKLKGAA